MGDSTSMSSAPGGLVTVPGQGGLSTASSPVTSSTSSISSTLPILSASDPNAPVEATAMTTSSALVSTGSSTTTLDTSSATGGSLPASQGSSGSTISGGAVGGIAIGAVIVGALVGFLIAFFLLSRRLRQARAERAEARELSPLSDEERNRNAYKPVVTTTALNPPSPYSALDNILPQPTETKYLIQELASLKVFISNHVANFYSTEHMRVGDLSKFIDRSTVTSFAAAAGFREPGRLLELLASSSTRQVTLRFFIAFSIISRLQGSGGPFTSLLPLGLAASLGAIKSSDFEGSPQDFKALSSLHRRLFYHLTNGFYKREAFRPGDDRVGAIEETLAAMNAILKPFAFSKSDMDRESHLRQLVQRASSYGAVLMGQGATFVLNWGGTGELPVFPSLFQTTEDDGTALREPILLGQAGEMAPGLAL